MIASARAWCQDLLPTVTQVLKDWVFNKGAVDDTARLSMVKAYAMLQEGDVGQATLHTDNAVNQTLQR